MMKCKSKSKISTSEEKCIITGIRPFWTKRDEKLQRYCD